MTRSEQPASDTLVSRLLRRAVAIEPGEGAALGWAWLYIFALLVAYYIMRPIRDEMGVAGGVKNLPWLFTGTLIAMIALNVPFGWLVRSLPRIQFIAITYRFFAANILVFAVLLWLADKATAVWVGRAFFIWLSVFNLFVVSVFWAMIVDTFDSDQGKRLFASIAAGATVGAVFGSLVVVALAKQVPQTALLIAAAVLLEIAVFGAKRLSQHATAMRAEEREIADERVGGGILAGFTKTFSSPYLANTALFLLLFSVTSTFLYFDVTHAAAVAYKDHAARTHFFATIDLITNIATLVIQLFLSGRILRVLGITLTLALLPAVSVLGFGLLAAAPTIVAIIAFQAVRRAGNFAIARPTREILFTVVPREDRYKAKAFIDTVIYRLGDQIGAWSTDLHALPGFNHISLAVLAIPLSVAWLLNSLWLGRRQEAMSAEQGKSATDAVAAVASR